jgi:hypothetical protein
MLIFLLLGLLVLKQTVSYLSKQLNIRSLLPALMLSLTFFSTAAISELSAQTMPRTVVSSSGEYLDNLLFGTLNFTVGEVAVNRYQGAMDLAEGFHRVYYDLVVSNEEVLPADWSVLVYPNPTTEYLKVEFSKQEDRVNAQLYSSTGQLILQQSDISYETELDLQALPAGTYWLRLIDETGRQGSFQIQKVVR